MARTGEAARGGQAHRGQDGRRVRTDAEGLGRLQVGGVVDVTTQAGHRPGELERPSGDVPSARCRPEAGREPVVRRGVGRGPGAGGVRHEGRAVGGKPTESVVQLGRTKRREVRAERHRVGVGQLVADQGRGRDQGLVEVPSRVGHHPAAEAGDGGDDGRFVGGHDDGGHVGGAEGREDGVEGERRGQLGADRRAQDVEPGLAHRRRLDRHDHHEGPRHERSSCQVVPDG